MPLGLTAIRLLLAATCVATLWTAYSVARPSGDGGPKAGLEPVRVLEQPAFEAPPIRHAAKLPALAPPPAEIARSLAPAERHRTTASDGTGRGAPASDGDVAPSARVARPEPQPAPPAPQPAPPAPPVNPPAPPADPPAPPADPPAPPAQPRHPPPTQEPGVLTFDDSG